MFPFSMSQVELPKTSSDSKLITLKKKKQTVPGKRLHKCLHNSLQHICIADDSNSFFSSLSFYYCIFTLFIVDIILFPVFVCCCCCFFFFF